MEITRENLDVLNAALKNKSPEDIIRWALGKAKRPVLTTNFGPFSASLIHAVCYAKPEIPVIWVDTGFNTPETYSYAEYMKLNFQLNLKIHEPEAEILMKYQDGTLPEVGTAEHRKFSEAVKLKPFDRAIQQYQPDLWFTNIRKGQTAHRDTLDILSMSKEGILKVSPFYYWSSKELHQYLKAFNLPNEFNYFDPTKVQENRECGIHI